MQHHLNSEPGRYAGFNLVSLAGSGGWYYSNRDAHPGRQVFRGMYGLSNHLLQTPWPKLLRLRTAVGHCVEQAGGDAGALHQQLIPLLQDNSPDPGPRTAGYRRGHRNRAISVGALRHR